jgi:8-oxo-dGTP pyrophosphatase MutT (NUDIX family)
LQRSPDDTHNADLWEFPGGKVDVGEEIAQSLNREVQEETGLIIEPSSELVYVTSEQILGGEYAGKLYVAHLTATINLCFGKYTHGPSLSSLLSQSWSVLWPHRDSSPILLTY